MKKLLLPLIALMVMAACNSERTYLSYRGLSMGMPASVVADSLQARGLALDTAQSDSSRVVLNCESDHYTVTLFCQNDTLSDIVEAYAATTNDSTAALWQTMRDDFEKQFGRMPGMTHRADLHKEAVFETDGGTLILTLLNTYTPTVTARYSTSKIKN